MAHGPGVASALLLIPLYQRATVPLKAAPIMRVIAVLSGKKKRARESQADETLRSSLVPSLLWATNHVRAALIRSLTRGPGCQNDRCPGSRELMRTSFFRRVCQVCRWFLDHWSRKLTDDSKRVSDDVRCIASEMKYVVPGVFPGGIVLPSQGLNDSWNQR